MKNYNDMTNKEMIAHLEEVHGSIVSKRTTKADLIAIHTGLWVAQEMDEAEDLKTRIGAEKSMGCWDRIKAYFKKHCG